MTDITPNKSLEIYDELDKKTAQATSLIKLISSNRF